MNRSAAIALVAAALLVGCSSGSGGDLDDVPRQVGGPNDAQDLCESALDYAGHRYAGHGELKRDPDTTGRHQTGVRRGCDDGNGAVPDVQVEVDELADISMGRAVLVGSTVYLRTDLPFPERIRGWFVAPQCNSQGSFELHGDWLATMSTRKVRFDGDIRPPYRVRLHVTAGPAIYQGATIEVHATTQTEPALGPTDVKTSLWQGGGLDAEVTCEDGRFVALGLTSTPG